GLVPAAGGPAAEAELERLASRIADGLPIGDATAQDGVADRANDGLRLIEKIAEEFRRAPPARTADVEIPQFRFAGLEVRRRLDEGSFGEIWRAYDPVLDLEVALKLHKTGSDATTTALLDEARCLARLRHPNILRVYGAAADGDRVGLWTELVRGVTLQ